MGNTYLSIFTAFFIAFVTPIILSREGSSTGRRFYWRPLPSWNSVGYWKWKARI